MQQQSLSDSNPQAYRLMGEVLLFLILITKRKSNYGNNNSGLLQRTTFTELH